METLFIGKNTVFLPQVNSTNSYAIDLLKNVNLPEGTVIQADHQTQGRGQRGHRWESLPASNLTVSVIVKPGFLSMKNRFFLYEVAALACYDALAEILNDGQIDIKIKWPNDILVNGKKIAGILIENNVQNGVINWCVAGIGINVNQESFGNLPNATSLKQLTNKDHVLSDVLSRLCVHFEKYYLALKSGRLDYVGGQYLSHLYGLNARLNFEYENEVRVLAVRGISEVGLLVLEDEAGRTIEADVKEVKWRY